jgi:hypothetical protein
LSRRGGGTIVAGMAAIALRFRAPRGASGAALTGLLALTLALPASRACAGDSDSLKSNRLEVGVEERIRSENWGNLRDFSDTRSIKGDVQHHVRYRSRAWAKLNLGPRTEAMVGLTDESRKITTPATDFTIDELVFETLYLSQRFGDRVTVKAGRQNLARGEGILFLDGGPLDGSRMFYYNAVDAAVNLDAAGKSRLDVVGISDPYRDKYLPRFNDKDRSLVEWNEAAVALFYSDTRVANTTLEGTYVFKKETFDPDRGVARTQPDRKIQTFDARAVRRFTGGWTATLEAAGQTGDQTGADTQRGWALVSSVKKSFDAPWKPSLQVGWMGFSGDDSATTRDEGWDPIFARGAKWSELYLYTLPGERGVGYWTNLSLLQVEVQAAPAKAVNLRATYYRMGAFHAFPGDPTVFATGKKRGDLLQFRADVKANDYLRGHLVGEHLSPGDYYVGQDPAWFWRVEVIASFQKLLHF